MPTEHFAHFREHHLQRGGPARSTSVSRSRKDCRASERRSARNMSAFWIATPPRERPDRWRVPDPVRPVRPARFRRHERDHAQHAASPERSGTPRYDCRPSARTMSRCSASRADRSSSSGSDLRDELPPDPVRTTCHRRLPGRDLAGSRRCNSSAEAHLVRIHVSHRQPASARPAVEQVHGAPIGEWGTARAATRRRVSS